MVIPRVCAGEECHAGPRADKRVGVRRELRGISAALVRLALEHIEPERLILSTDCGFGRQGMSRLHAFHKMVSMVQGANIVRRELGLEEVEVRAADPRFALIKSL